MRPIGNGRPNSGTTARLSDLSGEGGEGGELRIQARIHGLHERGSGRNAKLREPRTPWASPGANRKRARVPAGSRARPTDPPAQPLDRQARLEAFAAFPQRLEVVARAAARRPTPAGEWGPSEVVRHLVAVEREVWQARFAQIAGEDDPHWGWTEPGLEPSLEGASLDEILAAFEARRAATATTVRALDDAGWARYGTHATYGVLDVAGPARPRDRPRRGPPRRASPTVRLMSATPRLTLQRRPRRLNPDEITRISRTIP